MDEFSRPFGTGRIFNLTQDLSLIHIYTEIGSYLTESTDFTHTAPFGGSIEYLRKGREPSTLAMLQGLVSNEGDGWQWTLEELDRYYEANAAQILPQSGVLDRQPNLLHWSESVELSLIHI